jgi:hypothetical protein
MAIVLWQINEFRKDIMVNRLMTTSLLIFLIRCFLQGTEGRMSSYTLHIANEIYAKGLGFSEGENGLGGGKWSWFNFPFIEGVYFGRLLSPVT